MKKDMRVVVHREERWFVAQCLDVDIASQGRSEMEAINNLRDALELHFTPPLATLLPEVRIVEFEAAG